MDTNLLLICGLTFVIHLVGTLAYAVRSVAVRLADGLGERLDSTLAPRPSYASAAYRGDVYD
jgi:hypothetical protein